MFRALCIVMLVTAVAPAQAELYSLTDPVEGQAGKTYLDLARAVVTDLEMVDGIRARGETVIPVRHLMEGYGGLPPAQIEIEEVYALPLLSGGKELTLALLDLGRAEGNPEATVIAAVFDERLRLLDAADIAMDRQVGLEELPFQISQGDDAIVFYSRAGNSPPFNTTYEMVFFREGRLQLIDWFATLDGHGCDWQGYQYIRFESLPFDHPGFWPIKVTIDDKLEVDPTADCEFHWYEPYDTSVSVTYRWDELRHQYSPETDDLARLMQMTHDRY